MDILKKLRKFINLWVLTTDPKRIGIMYLVTSTVSEFIAFVYSSFIKIKLSSSGNSMLGGSASVYYNIVTMHDILMIFFMVMPILIEGFDNFCVPLQIRSADMAFPRMNSFSFWLLPLSLTTLMIAMRYKTGQGAAVGWTLYPPLISIHKGNAPDFLIISLHLNDLSSIGNAINITTTIINHKAMKYYDMSIYT